jgi:hypothetical protein
MEIKEILKQLEFNTGAFPRQALEQAMSQPEQITPALLEILEYAHTHLDQIAHQENYMAHIYAMFLLSQFREPRAYPLIADFFSKAGEAVYDLTGDVLTEDLARFLASVCAGDTRRIAQLVEDPQADEYVRGSALEAWVILVTQGIRARDDVLRYYQDLFHGKLPRTPSHVWGVLVNCSADLHLIELQADIQQAFADGLVNDSFVDPQWVERRFAMQPAEIFQELRQDPHNQLIENVVKEMEWWASFQSPPPPLEKPKEPSSKPVQAPPKEMLPALPKALPTLPPTTTVKVGRNDPCPCGSGKKYKKCCGVNR